MCSHSLLCEDLVSYTTWLACPKQFSEASGLTCTSIDVFLVVSDNADMTSNWNLFEAEYMTVLTGYIWPPVLSSLLVQSVEPNNLWIWVLISSL